MFPIQLNTAIGTAPSVTPHTSFSSGFSRAIRPIPKSKKHPGNCLINRQGDIAYVNQRGQIVAYSALKKDEWERLSEIVVEAASKGTQMLADVPKETYDNVGVLAAQYNVASQLTDATVSMSGRSRSQQDNVDFNLVTTPLPVIHKEVEIGERQLQASRMASSGGIDTHSVFEATRVVVEKIADILYNGFAAISFNGATIYGLTTHPDRNTGSGGDWGTITNIHTNVVSMIASSVADYYTGPWTLDVATTQHTQMLARFTDGSGNTALEEVMRIPGIEGVVRSDQLAAGSAVLRQNGRNVLEFHQVNLGGQNINGVQIALVEWMSGDGFVHHMKVLAIAVPVIKSDYPNQSGIVHFTGI